MPCMLLLVAASAACGGRRHYDRESCEYDPATNRYAHGDEQESVAGDVAWALGGLTLDFLAAASGLHTRLGTLKKTAR